MLGQARGDGKGERWTRASGRDLESGSIMSFVADLSIDDGAGIRLAATLDEGGHGSAVLIVHGILGHRRLPEVLDLAAELARDHDVLAADMRGHGDTRGRFTWGREEWRGVAAAARVLKAPGRTVTALGFSFGGYHAVRAVLAGAPIDRLILVGAPVDLEVTRGMRLGRVLLRHVPPTLRRPRRAVRLEWPRRLRERALQERELGAIVVPTLVIHSGDDWLVGRRHAEAYSRGIPGAETVEIPRGLHAEYLMLSERERFLRAVRGFLAR